MRTSFSLKFNFQSIGKEIVERNEKKKKMLLTSDQSIVNS